MTAELGWYEGCGSTEYYANSDWDVLVPCGVCSGSSSRVFLAMSYSWQRNSKRQAVVKGLNNKQKITNSCLPNVFGVLLIVTFMDQTVIRV